LIILKRSCLNDKTRNSELECEDREETRGDGDDDAATDEVTRESCSALKLPEGSVKA